METSKIKITKLAYNTLEENPLLVKKLKPISLLYKVSTKELFIEVLCFLYLIHLSKQKLSPSVIVDLAWHEFILFTKLYNEFCHQNFKKFIHHSPSNSTNQNINNFLKTIRYYCLIFGKPHAIIWGDLAFQEWNNAQCGT